jgi:hypothetical protein
MSPRRNPFDNSQPSPDVAAPPNIYDSLRVATPHRRNRRWEKEHLTQKVVYRGVDPRLALQVKTLAGNLLVPEGEVARALLEHALRAYAEGDLNLNSCPNPLRLRMTLFPSSDSPHNYDKPKKAARQKSSPPSWRIITTWRGFPADLKQEIAALASEEGLHVPVGELVTALLRYGLKAYESGLLKLEPVQRTTGFMLVPGGKK